MVPSHIEVVAALPLTANGKVDRRTLALYRPSPVHGAHHDDSLTDQPDDVLERELCALWATGLGVPRVGRAASFYELGADSLIMARMAGRLREKLAAEPYLLSEVPFDTLLRQLVNQPTVAALAAFVRARSDAPRGTDATPLEDAGEQSGRRSATSNGVLIPFGGGNRGPLRVVFHAGLGTMDCFRPLLAELAAQQAGPVLGIAIADAERYCALPSKQVVERVADDYAERLIHEGKGSVQLIGYCLGGLFATEVARRLSERGVLVEDLVLVSSHPVVFDVEDDLMIEVLFVPNLHVTLQQAGFGSVEGDELVRGLMQVIERHGGRVPAGSLATIGGDAALESVAALFRGMMALSRPERFAAYVRALAEVTGEAMPVEMALGLFEAFRQSFRAARFTPMPFVGDLRFLRPTGASGFAPGMDRTTLEFWRTACLGDVSVIDIEGNHFSCIDEQHARRVAELIAAPLVERQRRSTQPE
jgi:pyochelin synthetase